jgi:hypothetical protein
LSAEPNQEKTRSDLWLKYYGRGEVDRRAVVKYVCGEVE